jgi:polyhydroxyalkanoate synthesis regulator protein
MSEIAEMVRQREDVRVVDGETGEDLTKRVLEQLILEQQNAAQLELLPVALLHQIIAVRSQPIAGWLEQYLTAGAEFLDRQSRAAAPAMRGVTDSFGKLFPWLDADAWKNAPGAADMAAAFTNAARAQQETAPSAGATSDEPMLQRELADLQRRFADLAARFTR